MGFLSSLVGGGVGKLAEGVAGAINQFVETDEEKKAAELLLMKAQQMPDKWQAEINKIEAGHRSIFVAGWRPALGWVCVIALGYAFVLRPFLIVILNVLLNLEALSPDIGIEIPPINVKEILSLIFGMLGLGGLRSYEKKHGLTG